MQDLSLKLLLMGIVGLNSRPHLSFFSSQLSPSSEICNRFSTFFGKPKHPNSQNVHLHRKIERQLYNFDIICIISNYVGKIGGKGFDNLYYMIQFQTCQERLNVATGGGMIVMSLSPDTNPGMCTEIMQNGIPVSIRPKSHETSRVCD